MWGGSKPKAKSRFCACLGHIGAGWVLIERDIEKGGGSGREGEGRIRTSMNLELDNNHDGSDADDAEV